MCIKSKHYNEDGDDIGGDLNNPGRYFCLSKQPKCTVVSGYSQPKSGSEKLHKDGAFVFSLV